MRFPVQLPCKAKLRNSVPPRATNAEMYLPRGGGGEVGVARLVNDVSPSFRQEQAEMSALFGPESSKMPLQELGGNRSVGIIPGTFFSRASRGTHAQEVSANDAHAQPARRGRPPGRWQHTVC